MKRNLRLRLSGLQRTGEVQTGRQLADNMKKAGSINLFPGEGREEDTAFGRCYLRELKYPLDHRHGNSILAGALCCRGPELILSARDNQLNNFCLEDSLFLDIETTGLSGGTGTWAFLIGLGWIEKDSFILRQYFLRHPAEERSVLSHFAETVSGFPNLITFNGKMFDLPLIQTRQTLTGFRQTNPILHLDLLQCARNLWKKRLSSRSLRSLEEALLGLQRCDDIPGAEIPAVYFDYLRRGRSEQIIKVFQHNVLDILSMVTLLERISQLSSGSRVEHPAEALTLGQLCLQAGRNDEGISYLREASSGKLLLPAEEASLELSFFLKKQKNWPEAAEIWEKAVEKNTANPVFYLELAKYYEHRCRRYQSALDLTGKAMVLTSGRRDIPVSSELYCTALRHRRDRLKQRLSRAQSVAADQAIYRRSKSGR